MSATHLLIDRRKFLISCAKKQISIRQLSKQAHCNGRYFTGNGNPIRLTVMVAGRVANILDVDLEWLLADEQEF